MKPGSAAKGQAQFTHDALQLAVLMEEMGLRHLHLVDLEGARQGRVLHWRLLENILRETELLVDFSGGIRTLAEVEQAVDMGAVEVGIGSIALAKPKTFHEWMDVVGNDRLILCADVRGGRISAVGGGMPWQEYLAMHAQAGVESIMLTDLDHLEAGKGPNFDLYDQACLEFPELLFIAHGGIADVEDVHQLGEVGVEAAVISEALHRGTIKLEDLPALQDEWD